MEDGNKGQEGRKRKEGKKKGGMDEGKEGTERKGEWK